MPKLILQQNGNITNPLNIILTSEQQAMIKDYTKFKVQFQIMFTLSINQFEQNKLILTKQSDGIQNTITLKEQGLYSSSADIAQRIVADLTQQGYTSTVAQSDYYYGQVFCPIFQEPMSMQIDDYYLAKLLGYTPGKIYNSVQVEAGHKITADFVMFTLQARQIFITCNQTMNSDTVQYPLNTNLICSTFNQQLPGSAQTIQSYDELTYYSGTAFTFNFLDENYQLLYLQPNSYLNCFVSLTPDDTEEQKEQANHAQRVQQLQQQIQDKQQKLKETKQQRLIGKIYKAILNPDIERDKIKKLKINALIRKDNAFKKFLTKLRTVKNDYSLQEQNNVYQERIKIQQQLKNLEIKIDGIKVNGKEIQKQKAQKERAEKAIQNVAQTQDVEAQRIQEQQNRSQQMSESSKSHRQVIRQQEEPTGERSEVGVVSDLMNYMVTHVNYGIHDEQKSEISEESDESEI